MPRNQKYLPLGGGRAIFSRARWQGWARPWVSHFLPEEGWANVHRSVAERRGGRERWGVGCVNGLCRGTTKIAYKLSIYEISHAAYCITLACATLTPGRALASVASPRASTPLEGVRRTPESGSPVRR